MCLWNNKQDSSWDSSYLRCYSPSKFVLALDTPDSNHLDFTKGLSQWSFTAVNDPREKGKSCIVSQT